MYRNTNIAWLNLLQLLMFRALPSIPDCDDPYPSLSDFHDYEPNLEFDDSDLLQSKHPENDEPGSISKIMCSIHNPFDPNKTQKWIFANCYTHKLLTILLLTTVMLWSLNERLQIQRRLWFSTPFTKYPYFTRYLSSIIKWKVRNICTLFTNTDKIQIGTFEASIWLANIFTLAMLSFW